MGTIEYTPDFESGLVGRARAGDQTAFAMLVDPLRVQLFAYIYRMVTLRQDTNDLMRDVLENIGTALASFRCETSFRVWLFTVATRFCLQHLHSKGRWRLEAQIHAELEIESKGDAAQRLSTILALPGSRVEVAEHIAFCFYAVARSLEPEDQAAFILAEILQFTPEESARIMNVPVSDFRQRHAQAYGTIASSFEGLCELINKNGACCQCSTLWSSAPPANRGRKLYQISPLRGAAASAETLLDARLEIVRAADLEEGTSHLLHDHLYRLLTDQEERRRIGSAAIA